MIKIDETPSEKKVAKGTSTTGLNKSAVQFVKFCSVGVLNTAVDLMVYLFLTKILPFAGSLIYLAKGISFVVATMNSFLLNRKWTFAQKGDFQVTKLLKFYLAIGMGIFINMGIHFMNVQIFNINEIISVLIAAVFTASWGFTLSKYFVFK